MSQLLVCVTREHLEEGLPLAAQLGLGIELQTFAYKGELNGDWRGELAREKELLQGHAAPLTMHCMMLEGEQAAMRDAAAEYSRVYGVNLEIAAELGAKLLVVHPFRHEVLKPHRYEETGEYRRWQVDFFAALLPRAEELGVGLVLENLCETGPRVLGDVLDELDTPFLRACLDVGHANIYSEVPLVEWAEALGSRLGYLHLHNNHGEQDEHNALTDGSADIPALLARLRELELRPWLSVEASGKEAAMKSVEFLLRQGGRSDWEERPPRPTEYGG